MASAKNTDFMCTSLTDEARMLEDDFRKLLPEIRNQSDKSKAKFHIERLRWFEVKKCTTRAAWYWSELMMAERAYGEIRGRNTKRKKKAGF